VGLVSLCRDCWDSTVEKMLLELGRMEKFRMLTDTHVNCNSDV
jgi:hypothetical protein